MPTGVVGVPTGAVGVPTGTFDPNSSVTATENSTGNGSGTAGGQGSGSFTSSPAGTATNTVANGQLSSIGGAPGKNNANTGTINVVGGTGMTANTAGG